MEYQPNIVASGFHFEAIGPQREDTASINVRIMLPGDTTYSDFGIWDKRSGGELDSEDNPYRAGGMADRISLGGPVTPGNNTLSRLFRGQRDQDRLQRLYDAVGRSQVVIAEQPMDIDGNAYGRPLVWQGRLKRCTPPPRDSTSSGPAMIEIEVTTSGRPTA